jgi:hypothetical protein
MKLRIAGLVAAAVALAPGAASAQWYERGPRPDHHQHWDHHRHGEGYGFGHGDERRRIMSTTAPSTLSGATIITPSGTDGAR